MPTDKMDDNHVSNQSQEAIDSSPKIFEEKAKPRPSGDYDSIRALTQAVTQELTPTDDATYRQEIDTIQTSDRDYGRLSIADLGLIARLAREGRTQRQIAAVIGCSQPTVSYAIRRLSANQDDLVAVMKAKSQKALEQWETATEVAAKRGDHRPAREFIEAAHPELRPQATNSAGGVGVTIVIGQPGSPVGLPTIEVSAVTTQAKPDLRPSLSPPIEGESLPVSD